MNLKEGLLDVVRQSMRLNIDIPIGCAILVFETDEGIQVVGAYAPATPINHVAKVTAVTLYEAAQLTITNAMKENMT